MKVYGDIQSGNCYKVKMALDFLRKKYEWEHVDILAGDTKTPAYLAKNDAGKIPLLALDDGRYLSESNAIINYLAHGSKLIPTDVYDLACVQKWQFFEQYSHEPYIAVARYINKYLGLPEARKAEYESLQAGGHKALKVMERQLSQTPFLVNDSLTTADISLYAYTHVCFEGGFSLSDYPNIQAWLRRIEALPNYSNMA
ncbi:MAG: glutathione S-transferase [Glaciecola sp.]|jgi:glutathione S-transferase